MRVSLSCFCDFCDEILIFKKLEPANYDIILIGKIIKIVCNFYHLLLPILIFPVQTSTVTVHYFRRPKTSNFRWQSLQSRKRTDELHIWVYKSLFNTRFKTSCDHLFFFFNKLYFLMTAVCVFVSVSYQVLLQTRGRNL